MSSKIYHWLYITFARWWGQWHIVWSEQLHPCCCITRQHTHPYVHNPPQQADTANTLHLPPSLKPLDLVQHHDNSCFHVAKACSWFLTAALSVLTRLILKRFCIGTSFCKDQQMFPIDNVTFKLMVHSYLPHTWFFHLVTSPEAKFITTQSAMRTNFPWKPRFLF